MSKNRVEWTAEMLRVLCELRAARVPLYHCAERIGVGYATAVFKARELGLAARFNHGRIKGVER